MSASLFVRCVRVSVLALLATTAAGWGLSRNPANEDLQDIQILPQSSSGTPAVLRDHYWYNAKTGEPAMTAASGAAAHDNGATCRSQVPPGGTIHTLSILQVVQCCNLATAPKCMKIE